MKDITLNRRNLLLSSLGMGAMTLLPRRVRASGHIKRMVVLRAFGGWDVTFCMDPKLTSSTIDGPDYNGANETIETYSGLPIMTNVSKRPNMDSFFSLYGSNVIAVNGVYVGSLVHEECRNRILTGTRSDDSADIGALTAIQEAEQYTLPYIDLTGGAFLPLFHVTPFPCILLYL